MPNGTMIRNIFGRPSGSNSCAIATGMPFSSRPSFVTTQTCLLLVVRTFAAYLRPGRIHELRLTLRGLLLLRLRLLLRGGLGSGRGLGRRLLGLRQSALRQAKRRRCQGEGGQCGCQRPAQRPGRCDPIIHCKLVPYCPRRRPCVRLDGRLFDRLSPCQIRRERDLRPLPDSRIRACNKATNASKLRAGRGRRLRDKFALNRSESHSNSHAAVQPARIDARRALAPRGSARRAGRRRRV